MKRIQIVSVAVLAVAVVVLAAAFYRERVRRLDLEAPVHRARRYCQYVKIEYQTGVGAFELASRESARASALRRIADVVEQRMPYDDIMECAPRFDYARFRDCFYNDNRPCMLEMLRAADAAIPSAFE